MEDFPELNDAQKRLSGDLTSQLLLVEILKYLDKKPGTGNIIGYLEERMKRAVSKFPDSKASHDPSVKKSLDSIVSLLEVAKK